jgi:hypothetical protein
MSSKRSAMAYYYRWFRAPNVIPIEQWRREQESAGDERKVG